MKKTLYPIVLLLCASFTASAQDGYAALAQSEQPEFMAKSPAAIAKETTDGLYFTVNPVGFNSKAADILPRPYGDQIIISSNRKGKATGKFFNLYLVAKEGKAPTRLKGSLYSKLNDASPAFTADGQTVYFTRNHEHSKFYGKDKNQPSRLSLYKSTKKGKKWSSPELLPFTDPAYSTAHPVLNQTGDRLYFVSDMPGGFGGADIYSVAILEDGSFGTPENLGKEINTATDETSPYLAHDQMLFFASKGHNSMGGYDLFAADLDNKATVVNLGPQINTAADEFGLMINGEESGYFASNRDSGSYDIYAFVTDNSLKQLLTPKEEAIVAIPKQELKEAVEEKVVTQSEVVAEKIAQETMASNAVNTKAIANATENATEVSRAITKTMAAPKTGDNLIAYLAIDPVHFEFDSAEINAQSRAVLQKVADYLKNSSVPSLEIIGHTDSVGNPDYNKALSLKRANNVKIFLREAGVKQRITSKGMGEDNPLIDCLDCSDEEYGENRRAEIKVKN